ncbi:MAG: lytic murein transglycosylase B [Burkholderiales bacterium]
MPLFRIFFETLRTWVEGLLCLLLIVVPLSACAGKPSQLRSPDGSYAQREDVMRFAQEVAERHSLKESWVRHILRQASFQPAVTRHIMPAPPGMAKNWEAYRARMVEPTRLRLGLQFWRNNERWLSLAQQRYGVPPEIVLGIIGVETIYGQHMGGFRVVDALTTLAFDFPAGRSDRSGFFRQELEHLLLLARRENIDPLSLKGSFAGAIGMPQFMPGSIRNYAVDFDHDGHIDLRNNTADVIGSVAHYLAQFGWERDWPTHFEVVPPGEQEPLATLLGPDIVPLFSPQEFTEKGAQLPHDALEYPGKLALVQLQNGAAEPSYVAGTSNFYAITRYNWSSYYAMAVISLGEALRKARYQGS